MKVVFDSAAERREHHQHIQEAAREVDDDSTLLRALFYLENGKEESSKSGFGWVSLNDPESATVRFRGYEYDEFTELVDTISEVTAADLGDADDEQLVTLADYLVDTASALREAATADN